MEEEEEPLQSLSPLRARAESLVELTGKLSAPLDLYREAAKPEAEWVREAVRQISAEVPK